MNAAAPRGRRTLAARLAAAAASAALFFFLARGMAPWAGLWHDEAVHGAIAVDWLKGGPPGDAFPGLPWMKDSYQGALKSMVLREAFARFGVSTRVLRLTTSAFGAACVFFTVLLAGRRWGTAWALALGLILACDPALLIACVYDTGPAALSLALKAAGLWLLADWARARANPVRIVLGGALLGAALWDKAHFAWVLLAAPLAVLAVGSALTRRRRAAAVAAAGAFVGALPLLVYNALRPLDTLRNPGSQAWPLSAHLAALPHWALRRSLELFRAFSGRSAYFMVSGVDPGPARTLALALAVGLGAVAVAALSRRAGRLREARGWLAFLAAGLAFAVLSPVPVKWHHFYVLYPFHWLALFAALRAAPPRARRAAAPALVALTAVLLAGQARGDGNFVLDLKAQGGSAAFDRGSRELGAGLAALRASDPGLVLLCAVHMDAPVAIESGGRARCSSVAGVLRGPGGAAGFRERLAEGRVVWARFAWGSPDEAAASDALLDALDRDWPSDDALRIRSVWGDEWAYARRARPMTGRAADALWARVVGGAAEGASPARRRTLALALQDGGVPGEAARLLGRLSAGASGDPALLRDAAVADHLAGRDDEAEALLRRALAAAPGLASARLTLAAVLEGRGRAGEARAVLLAAPAACADAAEPCRLLERESAARRK